MPTTIASKEYQASTDRRITILATHIAENGGALGTRKQAWLLYTLADLYVEKGEWDKRAYRDARTALEQSKPFVHSHYASLFEQQGFAGAEDVAADPIGWQEIAFERAMWEKRIASLEGRINKGDQPGNDLLDVTEPPIPRAK